MNKKLIIGILYFIILVLTVTICNSETLIITYRNPSDNSLINSTSTAQDIAFVLPDTNLDIYLQNDNYTFQVKIPSVSIAQNPNINLSIRNVSAGNLFNTTFNLGSNLTNIPITAYAFKINHSLVGVSQYNITFNYSGYDLSSSGLDIDESTLRVYKFNYNFTTNSTDYSNMTIYTSDNLTIDTTNDLVTFNVTGFSGFGLAGQSAAAPAPAPAAPGPGGARTGGGAGGGRTICHPNWVCEDWTPCGPTGKQARVCIDLKNCNTLINKPPEIQDCEYIPPVPRMPLPIIKKKPKPVKPEVPVEEVPPVAPVPAPAPVTFPAPPTPIVPAPVEERISIWTIILGLIIMVAIIGGVALFRRKIKHEERIRIPPAVPIITKPPIEEKPAKPVTEKVVEKPEEKPKLPVVEIKKEIKPAFKPKIEIEPIKQKQLEMYIFHALAQGFTRAQITKVLLTKNWPKEVVVDIFDHMAHVEKHIKKEELHLPHPDLEKATMSIVNMLNKGFDERHIKESLLRKGWKQHMIDEIFENVEEIKKKKKK